MSLYKGWDRISADKSLKESEDDYPLAGSGLPARYCQLQEGFEQGCLETETWTYHTEKISVLTVGVLLVRPLHCLHSNKIVENNLYLGGEHSCNRTDEHDEHWLMNYTCLNPSHRTPPS